MLEGRDGSSGDTRWNPGNRKEVRANIPRQCMLMEVCDNW